MELIENSFPMNLLSMILLNRGSIDIQKRFKCNLLFPDFTVCGKKNYIIRNLSCDYYKSQLLTACRYGQDNKNIRRWSVNWIIA